jgi:hypothetical protein
LVALTVPGAVVFLEHALGDRVQANWPSVLYPAAAIAAAGLRWRPWRSAAALGFAITALVYVQAAAAPFPLPPRLTAVLARLSGWPGLAAQIALAQQQAAAAFVATDEYGLASELARELPPDVPVIGVAPRWRYFDLPPATAIAGHTGLLIRRGRRTDAPDPAAWASIEAVGTITRLSGGVATETYKLYRVVGRANAADAVLLPRPQGGPSDAAANP